MPYSKHQAKIL